VARKAAAAVLGLLSLAQALSAGPAAGSGGRSGAREPDHSLPPGFLGPITPDRISSIIERLQSFGTRFAYSDRAVEAADYIASEFDAMNLSVTRQDFVYNGFVNTNVLATLTGRNASLPALVLGAHYDSLNGTDSLMNAYAPAPGADDDASGVAAVLAIAAAFARAGTDRTIIFAAFANEEMGRIGSREFVRRSQLQPPGLYAGICFDMIGYNQRYPKMDMVTNNASQWLCDVVLEANRRNILGVGLEKVVTPDNPQNWSDQVSFWEAGLPAMYFIEDENPTRDSACFKANPYYHTGQDTLDKLNLTLMTKVARLGAASAAALAGLALPDFRVDEGGMPGGTLEGDTFSMSMHLGNTGAPGPYEFNVTLEVDGLPVWRQPAGPDMWVAPGWTAVRGRHLLSLVLDSDDRYIEWNEANNRITITLDIPARPDLRVAGFWATDGTPVPGRAASLVVLVENAGGPVESARLVIYEGDGSNGMLLDRPVNVVPGDLAAVIQEIGAPQAGTEYTAEVRDVAPREAVADNNRMTLMLAPDVLDREDFRIVVEPDVVRTFENVEVSVEGASEGFSWFIDFGDGHEAGWTDAPYSHVYARAGNYFVNVILRDGKGAVVGLEPMPVAVQDRPPAAVIAGPDTAYPGRPAAFSGAASRDRDGAVVQYLWDFGEGPKEFGPDVSHTFTAQKTYPVRLTVTDDNGQSSTALLQVDVVDRPPTARAAADTRLLSAGGTVSFNGSSSWDPDGAVASWFWDFGDGANATGPLAAHTYAREGTYTARLTVTDDGGAAGSVAMNVTVLKKAKPLPASPPPAGSPAVIPAMLVVMVLIASVLILRGRPAHPREEEE
jgi:PKD repeat protein